MDNLKEHSYTHKSYEDFSNVESQKNFSKDIDIGEDGEEFIKNFLINKGYNFISDNKDYRYDLLMSYKDKSYTY